MSTNQRPWLLTYERYNIAADIHMPAHDSSLLTLLDNKLVEYAEMTAYIAGNYDLSYATLNRLSLKVASYLQALGLKQGDAVGIMLPNVLHYPVIALGIIRAGMVMVSINPSYNQREFEYYIQDSQIQVMFILDKFEPYYKQVHGLHKYHLQHVIICRQGDLLGNLSGGLLNFMTTSPLPNHTHDARYFSQVLRQADETHYQPPSLTLSDVATLQYTGGTTGIAKGAMLTHGNIIANVLQIDNLICSAYDDAGQGDTILAALPLYHVFSFTISVMYSLYRGCTGLLVADPRQINKIISTMRQYPPSFILGVNTLFRALLKNPKFRQLDFSQLKATIGGGMSILPTIAKRWHYVTGAPIIEGYGLSETAPVIAFNPMTIAQFTNKVGIPAPATDIVLLDADDNPVPIGERGEIVVKGPQVMKGYQNRSEETATIFTQNGYLRTGDIGIMDERGFIKIVDRKKDMIVVSGFNVYPNEIEMVMLEHPDVAECAAIAIPSHERGEEPKLFVVRRRNQVTAEELIEYGRAHLAGYKRPRHIEFVDKLPKSTMGKVLKTQLRKREGLE